MADKKRPAEFPTDWHYEAHVEALGRELAGYQRRIQELEAVGATGPALDDAKSGVEAVRAELAKYGVGQKQAAKRPKPSGETRG